MTNAEWEEILPHLRTVVMGEGRPLRDARHRIDGMFRLAVSGLPWHSLPEEYGKPDTVSRHFRRLAQMGLWLRLVGACANRAASAALRRIEYFICRAARRAMRILGQDGAYGGEGSACSPRCRSSAGLPGTPAALVRQVNCHGQAWLRSSAAARSKTSRRRRCSTGSASPPLRRQALAPPLGPAMTIRGVQRPFGLCQGSKGYWVPGDGATPGLCPKPANPGFRNRKTPLLHRDTRLDFAPPPCALSPPRWNRGMQ